jgi:hypothetical protein
VAQLSTLAQATHETECLPKFQPNRNNIRQLWLHGLAILALHSMGDSQPGSMAACPLVSMVACRPGSMAASQQDNTEGSQQGSTVASRQDNTEGSQQGSMAASRQDSTVDFPLANMAASLQASMAECRRGRLATEATYRLGQYFFESLKLADTISRRNSYANIFLNSYGQRISFRPPASGTGSRPRS